jgi:DNA-binding CsgD family transcriptional regulator
MARPAPNDAGLIGRSVELQTLREALDRARAGSPGVAVIEGEAGAGKTALMHAAFEDAGVTLLWADTREFAASEFGPLKDLLRRLRREAPDRFDSVRADHPELAWLLPDFRAGSGEAATGAVDIAVTPAAAQASRDALFDTLAAFVIGLAGGAPAALVFDDMHAADHASVELLARLAERLGDEPLLLVVAHRSDDLARNHPLRRLRRQWHQRRLAPRAAAVTELVVAPLDAGDAFTLASARLGAPPSPALAAELQRASGGLPLYLQELADTLVARAALQPTPDGLICDAEGGLPVPESMREAVMLRTAELDANAQRVLQRASVMGLEVDLELLAAADGDAGSVETLIDCGWLRDTTPGIATFRHALVRDAVYAQIPWTRRRRWHAEIAAALEAAGHSPDAACEHWLAAHDAPRARRALLARARRAAAQHAYADGIGHAARALEAWPDDADEAGRLDALAFLGDCALLARRPDEAAQAWNELCERAERAESWSALALGRRRLAVLWGLAGDSERRAEACEAASAALLRDGRLHEAAAELATAADALNLLARWRAVLDLVAKAWPLARAAGDLPLQVLLQSQRGRTLARMGRIEEGLADTRAAVDIAESNGLISVLGSAYQRMADCHEHNGAYATAREIFLDAADRCAMLGQPMQREACRACVLPVLVQNGDWSLGLALCDEIAADPHAPLWARPLGTAVGGELLALRGECRAARVRLHDGLRELRQVGFRFSEPRALQALAQCDWFDGRRTAALVHARAAMKCWAGCEDVHHIVPITIVLGTMFGWAGDAAGVASCVEAAGVAARGTGQVEALAALAHTMGEMHLVADHVGEAAAEFANAVQLGRDLPLPFTRAITLLRLADAESRIDQPGKAAVHLRQAIDGFDALGAGNFLRHATARLRAVAPQAMTAPDERREHAGLTPRQLQILGQVSQGHTDKEIARQLGLSHRTVEMHVGRLLATLACRTRAEAVARANELRLLEGASIR